MGRLLKKFSRFQSSKVKAIYDEDLIPMLKKAGLLERIEKGEIRCKYTDEVITLENLEGIIATTDGYEFVSTNAIKTLDAYGD